MTYHNFASRLSIKRISPPASAKEPAKPILKKPHATRRRLANATAAALLCFLAGRAEAGAQTDGARSSAPPPWRVNAPTLIITLTGLGVVLWRLPVLWRRDFDC